MLLEGLGVILLDLFVCLLHLLDLTESQLIGLDD